jgi:hypothetical protein
MKFLPDSAVVGTIGHARRRAVKSRRRKGRGKASGELTAGNILGGIMLMFIVMLLLSLVA